MCKTNSDISCSTCNATFNPLADAEYLALNQPKRLSVSEEWLATQPARPPQFTNSAPVLHFCSTKCLAEFLTNEGNHNRIAWLDPEKLPSEPEESRTVLDRYVAKFPNKKCPDHKESFEYWEPLFETHMKWEIAKTGSKICDFDSHIAPEEYVAYRKENKLPDWVPVALSAPPNRGPFLYVSSWSWAECDRENGQGDQCSLRGDRRFCGVECAINWCNTLDFDAKDYWILNGQHCKHCDSVRNKDQGYHEGITACGLTFCTPQCLLAHFEAHPEDATGWISSDEAFPPDRREYWTCSCANCKKDKPDARYLTADAPYESVLDDENSSQLCSFECLMELFRKETERFYLGQWYRRKTNDE